MRALLLSLLAVSGLAAESVSAVVVAGHGLPEWVHLHAGWFAHPRVSVEGRVGYVLFEPMVGVGVTGHLFGTPAAPGRPPRHSMLVDAQGRVAVDRWPPTSDGGERIGALGGLAGGYALVADGGFVLRARVGVVLYEDNGFAAAPDFGVGFGYAF